MVLGHNRGWPDSRKVTPLTYQVDNVGPFHRLVVLGESTVEGGGWVQNVQERWADLLAHWLEYCQEQPLEYHNAGLGASVLSTKSAGYEASRKPSAAERLQKQVIARDPDLLVIAYGLNDMRFGMQADAFRIEYECLLDDIERQINPRIVIVNVYHQTGLGWYPPADQGSDEALAQYNDMLRQVAAGRRYIHADVWAAQGRCDWLVHNDGVHANKVGNLLIANRVLEAIIHACPGVARNLQQRDERTPWANNAQSFRHKVVEPVHRWEDAR